MPKFRNWQRVEVQSIVADLTIKRIPDRLIIKHIEKQTDQTITDRTLRNIRQRIKKESYHWYSKLREGQYEYLHEFKERINEIVDLQRRHYEIIDGNPNNPTIQLASLSALHKLNVTLANYYNIIPYLTVTGQRQTQEQVTTQLGDSAGYTRMDIIEGCTCRQNGGFAIRHSKCLYCRHVWCPKAAGQDWCPNPQCAQGIAGCKFQPYDENYTWIKCNCGMWFQTNEILDAHKKISVPCKDNIV